VGNIKAWKGQETVVRATALLKKTWPGIKCLLVGGTVDRNPYKENLERIVAELRIDENIIFTGFQNNPADFMNVMDVVVHSSIEPEPFGMVNLEAMYLKKPVISTNIGGPREIFEDGEDGILIEPGDPMLLAQQISVLLNNPDLRVIIGQKAHEAVIDKFKITSTVRAVESIYEELCCKD
jgi:glycosyltransferase involved in cell wall biosynthesis